MVTQTMKGLLVMPGNGMVGVEEGLEGWDESITKERGIKRVPMSRDETGDG